MHALTLLTLHAAAIAAALPCSHGQTIYVHPGQKIQDAIDRAPCGTEIVIGPGPYTEQLLIKTDGITLSGQEGAVLEPPATFTHNVCSGVFGPKKQVGICVAGEGITMDKFVVEHRKVTAVQRPVQGVSISGLEVRGFTGANILILGGEHTRVSNNRLVDGSAYGFLTSGSIDTTMDGNTVTVSNASNPGFIAMCMDNFNTVTVTNNDLSDYNIGFCLQTSGAQVYNNHVTNVCTGAFMDPHVSDVNFHDNTISGSCAYSQYFGAVGVIVSGAQNAHITNNVISGMHDAGAGAAGVAVVDDPCTEQALGCLAAPNVTVVASGNHVVGNRFSDNDLDLYLNSTGTGNVFKGNKCKSSVPKGLCGKH